MLAVRVNGQASRKVMYTIPRYCALDGGAEISPTLDGVMLMTLEACDMIQARTRNSVYEIFLLEPKSGRALVRGGKRFAEPVEATVSGSTFGGCMIKIGWLGVGLRMEIYENGHRKITTPIQSLRVRRIDFGDDQSDSTGSVFVENGASIEH